MSTLSGELRNRIYALVMIERKTILINSYDEAFEKWEEPGLLLASKYIRTEALSFYYKSNRFAIRVVGLNFKTIATYIAALNAQIGSRPFESMEFILIHPVWTDLTKENIFPLVKLFESTNIELSSAKASGLDYTSGSMPSDWMRSAPKIKDALDQAVELGIQTRDSGLSHAQLEARFDTWLARKLAAPKVKRMIMQKQERDQEDAMQNPGHSKVAMIKQYKTLRRQLKAMGVDVDTLDD